MRLLLLTGARRGELLAAKWADFDLDAGIWTKPGSTTKQRTLHRPAIGCGVPPPRRDARDDDVEWLFPARRMPHRLDIDDAWNALRKTANIPDVRLQRFSPTPACWRRRGCRRRSLVACSVIRPRRRRTGTHTCSMIRCARRLSKERSSLAPLRRDRADYEGARQVMTARKSKASISALRLCPSRKLQRGSAGSTSPLLDVAIYRYRYAKSRSQRMIPGPAREMLKRAARAAQPLVPRRRRQIDC